MKTLTTLVLLLLIFSAPILAQTQITSGVIQGTISDPSGSVVPGASVEARNLDTNLVRTLVTDGDGRFVFLQLPSGRYTVTVTKSGYATLIAENQSVNVGQSLTLNLQMKISQLEEKVIISASPAIDITKTEASTILNDTAISTTPILGRKFEDLLTLTPGVSIVQGPDGDEINFAGQRGIFNNVSLDGGDYNNGFFGEQVGGQRAAIDITLEAVKEFQVVATGASAEFGRSAGGIVNVITKSGTNSFRGSIFHYQRHESMSSNTSDGKPLTDFHREQFGGTLGGPIVKDRMFYFLAYEQITGNLQRANLSEQVGDIPCPIQTPTIIANEGLINMNADCQRLALINFFRTTRNQQEGDPVRRPVHNNAILGKFDWKVAQSTDLAFSYNFNRSNKINETFDVATYGNSANGIEGPARIQVANLNVFSTLSAAMLNEFHFTYARENRPRSAVQSNVPADTAMGFGPTFRFGHPFFLGPTVDELFWRMQVRDNISIVKGRHTIKSGLEWIHSKNVQIFRGFFEGKYLFDSVTGFLRYASPASLGPGYGPNIKGCSNGTYVPRFGACPAGTTTSGGPLLLYLQGAGLAGPATDAAGFSDIENEELAVFAQDKWQIRPNFTLSYGLRWESQTLPNPVIPPPLTAYGRFLNDPRFPSTGYLPDQWKMFQPRVGFAWDISSNGKSVLRATWGIYNARQNMLSQVGSITTNGVQQQTIVVDTPGIASGAVAPVWPNVISPAVLPPGEFPLFSGVRVFSRDYANPRIYTTNVAFEQQIFSDLTFYVDFTHSKGVHLTRFLNINRNNFFSPQLGEVMVTSSVGKGLYRGITAGLRKRFSRRIQFEGNYTYSKDLDDDSNERDPFTDRSFDVNNLQLDYALADRDIKHKGNFYMFSDLPWGFEGTVRIQGRSAQPITPGTRTANNRNIDRKDNEFFSFDWRVLRPFVWGERYRLVPMVEMFNTFNNKNNINPLVTPGLFDFSGFLRLGVGDPRQLQLAIRFEF
jgi:Carboxypeptidase regulatory-like domain/TonB-dependent Receptor Plug Domain